LCRVTGDVLGAGEQVTIITVANRYQLIQSPILCSIVIVLLLLSPNAHLLRSVAQIHNSLTLKTFTTCHWITCLCCSQVRPSHMTASDLWSTQQARWRVVQQIKVMY